jgi:outer membrane protein assembly factor BamB
VVAVGSAGKVYGLDATTGEKRWESDVGPLHQRLASGPKPDDSPFSSGVGFAADVALVPGYDGDSGPGHALSGLDVRTGERLWQIPGAIGTFATPSRFTHEGRDHVIAGNRAGNVRCLDPRTGRVLWELTGAGNNSFTIPVTDTHMILNGVTGGGAATDNGRFAGYRITPDGAMKVWDQPAEIPGGKLPYTAVADGKLYANFVRTNMSDPADGLFILDVATGKVLSYQKFDLKSRSVIMVADGRVILERDGSHGKTELRMFEAAMPWKGLGAEWTQLRNPTTTGYIMVLSRPFVDGMLYMRGGDAIYAWDLRAAP